MHPLIDDYFSFNSQYSANTQRAYKRYLNQFSDWLKTQKINEIAQVNFQQINEYCSNLKHQNTSKSALNQNLSALKAFFNHLQKNQHISVNPLNSKELSFLTVDKTPTQMITAGQFNKLIKLNEIIAYDTRNADIVRNRNKILLKFLYQCPIKRSQIVSLTWNNITQNAQIYSAKLTTKNDKEFQWVLTKSLYEDLMDFKYSINCANINSEFVFLSLGFRTLGKSMSGKGVNDIVVRLAKEANLKISADSLRLSAISRQNEKNL